MSDSASKTKILGLPVFPSDTSQLASGSILTYDAINRQFKFIPGGGVAGVSSLNGLTGALALVAGTNVTIVPSGSNITISASAGVGGVTSLNSLTGALSIIAGANITVTPSGSNITVAATGGTGTVTHTIGSLTAGQLIIGNGSADITVGDLTGDVTTSGTTATTVAKIQGTTVTGTTGSGAVVLGTSPTISNPVVGTQSPGDNTTKAASTAFVTAAVAAVSPFTNGSLGIVIDGGGATPSTGSKGFVQAPYDCTIVSWTMLGDVAGAAQVTVKKSTYAAFPTTASIVAAAPPNIAATNQKNTSSSLGTWTTAVTKGDILEFNLDSVTTITRITLQLQVTRSD